MKIAVVGTGYVGLVTGTCLAEAGNDVVCVDIDRAKVARMRAGKVPIYEPGLKELFDRNIQDGRLSFTTNLKKGIDKAEVIFLALPTPPGIDGSADLSYILGVAKTISAMIKDYTVIIDKSTVPVGTAAVVREHITKNAKADFDVVSNPEFLREGRAVRDFQNPDRVIIGTSSDRAWKVMHRLYKPFVLRDDSIIIRMSEESAELTKYAANAMLANRISFMNGMANLCELSGADVREVQKGLGGDPRIGKEFLHAGPGYGGSCFPKDVQALAGTAVELGYDFPLLDAIHQINERQKSRLFEMVRSYYAGKLKGKTLALWGLAFKPKTDDIREAPALNLIDALPSAGAKVIAFDPEAVANVKKHFGRKKLLSFAKDEHAALSGADALIIITEWDEFKTLDFSKVKKLLKEPVIFDGRSLYELDEMQEQGFYYASIGRRVVKPA